MKKIIFKDAALQKQLQQDGYAVIKMLSDKDVERLLELYKHHYPNDNIPVHNSLYAEVAARADINKVIQEVVKPHLAKIFDGFIISVGILFVKNKAEDNYIGLHQDPTLLKNEGIEDHINFWCPLQDVNADNGAMQVLPGSHLFFPPVQAITIPFAFSGHSDLIYRQMKTIDMKAGEVLIFDNRIVHSSTSNITDSKRICVVLGMIPEDVEWVSYYKNPQEPNGPIEVYAQEPFYYLDPLWSNSNEPPKTGKKIGILDYKPVKFSEEEMKRIIENKIPAADFEFRLLPA